MTEKLIEIRRSTDTGQQKIGSILFPENLTSLEVNRTATSVNLKLPSEIRLDWTEETLCPMLSNLRVAIYLTDSRLGKIEVGMARDEEYRIATKMPVSISEPEFIWRDALAGLIFIEKSRGGDSPVFEFELHCELSYSVKCKRWFGQDVVLMQDAAADVRTRPFQRVHGTVKVSYPGDLWEKMIQTAFEASKDNPLFVLQPLLPFLTGNK
jgi:hypothetical protein